MKLKNGEIFSASASFAKLMEKDFPVKNSIALRQLINKLSEPLKVIEDVRQGLVRKHGKEGLKGSGRLEIITPNDPQGRPVSKSFPKFLEELNELMLQEVEVEFEIVKLPLEVDGKPLQLSVNDLVVLEKFIKVE